MKRMPKQKELAIQVRRPTGFDKFQIQSFVRPVDFIANNWMPERCEVNANLSRASRFRKGANQSELISIRCRPFDFAQDRSCETLFNMKFSDSLRAFWMNHLFQPNPGRLMFALSIKRRFDSFRFPIRPAPNDREIFFVQMSILHEQTKSTRGRGRFCDKDNAARFAIESIYDRNLSAIGDLERE